MRLNNGIAAFLTFTVLYSAVVVDSLKFLAVLPTVAKSHFFVGESLMKALAAKGHEVYVISLFPQTKSVTNYYDIPVEIEDETTVSPFENLEENFLTAMYDFFDAGIKASENVLKSHNVQLLMASNRKFDAVICEVFLSESLYGLSEHFKAPLIGISTQSALSWDTDMVGSPSPPSYVPSHMLKLTDRMSLTQRTINFGVMALETLFMQFYYLPRQAAVYNQYFPNALRDMYTVRKNTALVLLNTHVSLGYPRPYMPNHIEVAGLHIDRERKPLPQAMQKFIDEAEHGVVYFAMGSNIRTTDMPIEKRQLLFRAFSQLKQRVLLKFEGSDIPDKSNNIFSSHWFPQNDILAHENVKVFITHGGNLGITEAVHHGTPIIGIPMFGDQHHNIAKAVANGFALKLDYETLTAQDITTAIALLLSNETYTQRAKEVSARYRDQPMSPRDLAVFWVEYVARHKGAKYLHCGGLDLNFFQYHSLDILATLIGLLFAVPVTVHYLILQCLGEKPKAVAAAETRDKSD